MTKQEIRTTVKSLLKENHGTADSSRITALKEFSESDIVLSYVPAGGEADCNPATRTAILMGKTVALPRCLSGTSEMDFYILEKQRDVFCQLEKGSFGIMEPSETLEKLDLEDDSLKNKKVFVIVPGVAFTKGGKRCGHGKGYYDRFIPRLKKACSSVFLCGFCHDFQIFEDIPTDQYDQNMDAVIGNRE